MTKTELFNVVNTVVTPHIGINTVAINDFDTSIGIIIESSIADDQFTLVRQNFLENGWTSVTDGNGDVILNGSNKEVTIQFPGVYALIGKSVGQTRAYIITL